MSKLTLYLGNHLSQKGGYPSVAESMAPLLKPDVELHLVSHRKNILLRMLAMLWGIFHYGHREQPIVIDVYSTLNFYYALSCGLLCRILQLKYVCVLHGGNLPQRLQRNPTLCKVLFNGASKLIAPSRYLQSAFTEAGYNSTVIPNFLPIKNYPFRLRKTLQPRLLWVRAFDAVYNPQMAIYTLAKIKEHFPDAVLCMVGPDKDGSMQRCEELAKKIGVAGQVKFTGRLKKEDWIALSSDYDVFINTTNFDNTPVSVMEAIALGLPIVSTNVGGLQYLIEDEKEGLLVPPENEDAFAQAVLRLLKNPEQAKALSINARKKAETFSWEQVRPLWLEVLVN